ncbi:Protein TIFY 10b [Bienertia sinuspersici]
MSSSSAMGDSGRISGQKMSFSQTCNLLSQYVKEKRALGISDNRGPATMNLFPVSGKQGSSEDSNGCIGRTINLFPQLSGFNSSVKKRASPEPPAPQMTIFYGGQVLVFNDLPADKAKEVMDLASSHEASLKKRKVETTNSTPPSPAAVPVSAQNTKPAANPTVIPNQNMNVAPKFVNSVNPAVVPNASGFSSSLVGKPPSDVVANGGSSKPVEGKAWLGLNSLPAFQMQKQQQQH